MRLRSTVREDIAVAHLTESEFAVVAVGTEILEAVKSLAQAPKRL